MSLCRVKVNTSLHCCSSAIQHGKIVTSFIAVYIVYIAGTPNFTLQVGN